MAQRGKPPPYICGTLFNIKSYASYTFSIINLISD